MQDSKYIVSAIVSVYNCERFIRGCLDDLGRQTISNRIEIIAINSGSQQKEKDIINEYQERYDNIVYLETQNRETIYKAWNRGIQAATGKYIINANSDDRRRRDALEIMSGILENAADVDVVYPGFRITDTPNETFETSRALESYDPPDYDRLELLFRCLPGHFPMWRKSVHDRLGFFNEKLEVAGDHEFWLRISAECCFLHVKEHLGLYYRNDQGGELRNPILTKIEYLDIVNAYLDEHFIPRINCDKNLVNKLRKKQSDINFGSADLFYFNNRTDLAKKYLFKSIRCGAPSFIKLKLLLYCYLPRSLVHSVLSRSCRKNRPVS